jgi:hypothetical protein
MPECPKVDVLDFPQTKRFIVSIILRAILDEGPRSRDQRIQAILLVESFKLVPRPLDEGRRPKKWQIEAKLTWHLCWRENQLVQTKKTVLKGQLLIWRTKRIRLRTNV